METELVVIGGGASGMLCAAAASRNGVSVTLLEPNRELGRKLRITGKGRCNLTNECDVRTFMENVPSNARFLYSALNAFGPEETMRYFSSLGLTLKTERGRRVFPASDRAADVAEALEKELHRNGVRVLRTRATGIDISQGAVSAVETERGRIGCRAVAVATGGLSYPATGSTGDGLRFAQNAGHRIVPTRPSLVPLTVEGPVCASLMGLSLRNVALTVYENNREIFSEFGEMLFTHFGVSGPLVLSASSHMRRFDACSYRLEIDLKPALDEQALDRRLQSDFEKYRNSDFINSLGDLLPKKLIPVIVAMTKIDPRCKVHSVTHAQRQELLRLLKAFPLEVSGVRPIDEAIVTSGGVELRQISPKTMESKLVSGLYFIGEVLDLDAYTGGYNLQIAWSTGHAAACAIAEKLEQENLFRIEEQNMHNADKKISVAIDGPAGAGKSTLARGTAAAFGFIYVDTGAIYRTVGLAACRAGIASKDESGVKALLPNLRIELRHNDKGEQRMFLMGEDVSDQIRTPEISIYASDVSAMPAVRAYLLEMQRKLARENNVVMDGRDIGTVVLPEAGLKIFLTASPEARAQRRLLELKEKGIETNFEDVLRDIRYRDENDSTRAAAPLRAADDAVLLDTTDLTLEESKQAMLSLVKERFSL